MTPWKSQLASLVRQAFDIFNTFGKDAAALENIGPGFALALDGQDMVDISRAFKEWMKTKDAFPTPAQILKLSEGYKTIRLQSIGARIPKRWTQCIIDIETDKIIAEYDHPKDSLSPIAITQKHGYSVRAAMRRD